MHVKYVCNDARHSRYIPDKIIVNKFHSTEESK